MFGFQRNPRLRISLEKKMGLQGFTLVEVLVALSLTALVTAASYTGLSVAIDGSDQLRSVTNRLAEVDRAFGMLSRDLRHVIDRSIRDEFGDISPALTGGEFAVRALSFTSSGWRNPLGTARSDLQRINYYLDDDSLYRESFFTLDRTDRELSRKDIILSQVRDFRVRFLDNTKVLRNNEKIEIDYTYWKESWVPVLGYTGDTLALPVAIEVTLFTEDIGELKRLYEMTGD